ncbi:FMN reductase [Tsukamurella pulmonis]|uniref:NADPH-dependent FMN reductase n=1 Tax=Tsukamurella pulmonis TaxID=47312 RepID=UPI001EDF0306|nr:NAD(P)H-dependent oxidoreductase [Tsukamurella pulmonis]BDD81542.1 FMN reductase [Tsukamurella pulmonis]
MKIGIIVGSVRQGRKAEQVGEWVAAAVAARDGVEATLLDIAAFDLPILMAPTPPENANKKYDDPLVTAWSRAIDAQDGYVFVTPEYNHSVPGALKNAYDLLGSEWSGKTVAFVGYGATGAIRSVEHWRQITAIFDMVGTVQQVGLGLHTDFAPDGGFTPVDRRTGELAATIDALVALTARR